MKLNRFLSIALLVTMLLSFGVAPALAQEETTAEAAAATSTSTAFVLQNLGNDVAQTVVEFRAADGTVTKTYSDIQIPVGSSFNMDQRYESGNPGASSFTGSVVALSSQPLGSVVNLMSQGVTPSYESYNGLNEAVVGTNMRVLQVLKGVSSSGIVYNTKIVIQNTNTTANTTVNVTFVPDPVLNTAVGGTVSSPVSKSYTIPAGGTVTIDQATQTDPNIGAKFFGSARIESTGSPVGVVTTSDGGGQLLLAYPSYAQGSTTPIGLPSVYKNIQSAGLSYSTAFLIANMGNAEATVEIEYIAGAQGTVSGKDTVTIPAGAVRNWDQRFDATSITSETFIGSAVVTPVAGAGTVQPVAVMVNLRGGNRYAMTYGGLTSSVAAGGKMFLPVAYKNISSGGYSWSSTIAFHTFGGAAQVRVQYIDNRSGMPSWTSDPFTVNTGSQVDLRFDPSTAGKDTFFGAIVVEVISGQVGAVVQTRGLGGSGDALMAYQGLTQ